jgi:hypothetical protein
VASEFYIKEARVRRAQVAVEVGFTVEQVCWIWGKRWSRIYEFNERLSGILKEHDPIPGKRPKFMGSRKVANYVVGCQHGPVSGNIYGLCCKEYVEQINTAAEISGYKKTHYASLCTRPYLRLFAIPI